MVECVVIDMQGRNVNGSLETNAAKWLTVWLLTCKVEMLMVPYKRMLLNG